MSTIAANTHIRFDQEEPQPSPLHLPEEDDEPTGALAGSEDGEAGDSMDISEEELNDPTNQAGIEKSLYYKELAMRAEHAKQLATMFAKHQEGLKKKGAEGEEADEPAEKQDTKKLQLALKEQGRQEERLKAYRTKFAKNKILAKRKRDERWASVRAKNEEEKDVQKTINKAVRAAAKKQQDLAHKAAMAAVKELEGGLDEEAIKAAAMKAYAEALRNAALAEDAP